MAPADILFGSAVAFLAGVLLASFAWSIYAVLGVSALLFVLQRLIFKRGFSASYYLILVLLPLFLGFLYYYAYRNAALGRTNIVFYKTVSFSGVVSSEPQSTETVQRFTVALQPPLAGKITVITALFPQFAYGDLLEAEGVIEPARAQAEKPTSFFPTVRRAAEHHGSRAKEALLDFKQGLLGQFRKFLPPDAAALLSGLTFGARADFTGEFREQMALSGTTHLVALSGYNIAILVIAVAGVFRRWLSRRLTFCLTLAVIFLFVLMVGAEASVVRAAAMGFLLLLSGELGRLYSFRHAVALVAAVMVLANPAVLRFDIGFQLSFVSLLGIAYLSPALKTYFRFPDTAPGLLSWRENLTTTLGAQLAVAPLLLYHFGQFSLSSFIANILILAFVPLTMFFGFLLAGIGFLLPHLGFLIALLPRLLLEYEIGVIRLFAAWRLPVMSGFYSLLFFILFYVFLVSGMLYANVRRHGKNQ